MIRIISHSVFPIRCYKGDDYIDILKSLIASAFPNHRQVLKDSCQALKDVILFLATLLGYITPEMFTSLFVKANLGSIRTKINELVNDGYLQAIPLTETKHYGDSLINTIYVATPKARTKLSKIYQGLNFRCFSNKRKAALHNYFNAILQFSLLTSLNACTWYTEYQNEIRYRGNPRPSDVIYTDTMFSYDGRSYFVEIDTNTESNTVLINKICSYCEHDNWIRAGKWSICFVFRKGRATLAEKPRYKLSMIRVLQKFLHTEYARKRFTLFRDLKDSKLSTKELSEFDKKTCRAVIKDIIAHSPINFELFTITDFDKYVTDIERQTSPVYQEDIARIHDHLCSEKLEHICEYYLDQFNYPNYKHEDLEFLIGRKECFFVSLPRFWALLPLILFESKLLDNNTLSVKDKIANILERKYDCFSKDTFHFGFSHFGGDDTKTTERKYHSTVSFNKSFKNPQASRIHYFCIENFEYDLSSRLRVMNAMLNLDPKDSDVTIIMLVECKSSIKRHNNTFAFSNYSNPNVKLKFLAIDELLTDATNAKLYGY